MGSSGAAGKKREGGAVPLPPPPTRPYDVGGGDLSDSSGASDGPADVVEDTTHHRIQAPTRRSCPARKVDFKNLSFLISS